MQNQVDTQQGSILFIPHGGGPLPLLGDAGHRELVEFLQNIPDKLIKPSAIIVISAHWEAPVVTITQSAAPPLIYDYYGFPDESYAIQYPAPGYPELAMNIAQQLQQHGIVADMDADRGFDHGLFVPLKLMYPDASIPCVQLSLLHSLSPQQHIAVGKALAALERENTLIIGSGFSFHNLHAFFSKDSGESDLKNEVFQDWLNDTCTSTRLSEQERESRLLDWASAPHARYAHPREEHLLPLHVCYGIAGTTAAQAFSIKVLGKRASAFLW